MNFTEKWSCRNLFHMIITHVNQIHLTAKKNLIYHLLK